MSNIEFTNEDIINNDCSYKDRNTVNDTIFNSKTSKSESIIHTPSPLVLEKMESMRIFFKRNDMPFVVFPISNKSICVRNNKEVDDPNKRILYKSIIETLNIYRKGNKIYDPNALAYNFDEANIEKVNVDFNLNKIKEKYDEYEEICKMDNISFEFKPWNNNMIK